jgi:Flagellar assembly protein T, C-terminal domain
LLRLAGFTLLLSAALGYACSCAQAAQAQWEEPAASQNRNIFHVKYIAENTVYIDAGRNAGIAEGMLLTVTRVSSPGEATESVRFRDGQDIAQLRVVGVADTSAVCDVVSSKEDLQVGDLAYLTPKSIEQRTDAQNAEEAQNYPIVVSFTYGDPLDEEIRETKVPHVMSPPVMNQMRGRIGFDYGGIRESGGLNSRQLGTLLQVDMTRIGGSYWNFTGYWRGRLSTQSSGGSGGVSPATLTDLINRTYHLGFYYQNPDSPVTIGIGRVYLPWAPSLNTIDGGYFGRKVTRRVTVGFFGGSTPDPTSWSYNPDQHIAGIFASFAAGSFDSWRLLNTEGLAMTSIAWHMARQFAFFENTLSYGRSISIYNSAQVDKARLAAGGQQYSTGLTQSFTSVRFQPINLLTFTVNDNYFRNLPTFDPALISTGLLDQYLFQGLSGGVRVELPKHVSVYTSIGRSKTSTDTSQSWNQLYGITLGDLWKTGLRVDAHYSKFNSAFGQGNYQSVSVSKNLTESLRIEGQGGWQTFNSPLTANTRSRFINALVDWSFGPRYFVEGFYSWNSGDALNYQQWTTTIGYRFGGYRKR